MDFQLAEKKYRILSKKYYAGKITPQKFHAEIEKLRFQTSNGLWWQINAKDGTWLMFKDEQWISYAPSDYRGPKSLKSMLLILLKNLPKVFMISLAKRLILALIIASAVLVSHTFLLVGPNGGFAPGNVFYNNILALKGRVQSGTLFWMIATGVLFGSFHRLKSLGLKLFISSITITITDFSHAVREVVNQTKHSRSKVFVIAAIIGSLQMLYTNDGVLGFIIAIWLLLAVAAGNQSFIYLVSKLSVSDLERLFKRKQHMSRRMLEYGFYGIIGGILLSCVLLKFPYGINRMLRMGVVIAMCALLFMNSKKPSATHIWILLSVGAIGLLTQPVFADDGGWYEAGGTFSGWIRSEGAITAILMGVPPAIGGAVMVILMDALFNLFGDVLFNYPEVDWWPGDMGVPMDVQPPVGVVPTGVSPESMARTVSGEGTGAEPSGGTGAEPSEGTGAEPSEGTGAEPSEGTGAEPSEGTGAEPSEGTGAEPSEGTGAEPSEGTGTEPDKPQESDQRIPPQVPEELPEKTVKDVDQADVDRRKRLDEQRIKEEERIRQEIEKQRKLEILRERQKWLEAEAHAANRTARWWDWGTKAVEGVQKGCDISIDLLATVTGPAGQRVKDAYTLSKGLGTGVGKSIAEGGNWKNNMVDGAVKGAYDVVKGKAFDKAAGAFGNKVPGLKQYGPGDNVGKIWSKGRVGFFKDALTGKNTHSTVSGMVRDRFVEGAKNAAQSQGQSLATSSADKSICGWLSSKIKSIF